MGPDGSTGTAAQVDRDESAPDWAEGYSVADLRRITTLFDRHDAGLLAALSTATATGTPPLTSGTAG